MAAAPCLLHMLTLPKQPSHTNSEKLVIRVLCLPTPGLNAISLRGVHPPYITKPSCLPLALRPHSFLQPVHVCPHRNLKLLQEAPLQFLLVYLQQARAARLEYHCDVKSAACVRRKALWSICTGCSKAGIMQEAPQSIFCSSCHRMLELSIYRRAGPARNPRAMLQSSCTENTAILHYLLHPRGQTRKLRDALVVPFALLCPLAVDACLGESLTVRCDIDSWSMRRTAHLELRILLVPQSTSEVRCTILLHYFVWDWPKMCCRKKTPR